MPEGTPAPNIPAPTGEAPADDRCLDHETCRRTSAICLASHISHGVNNALNLVTLNAPMLGDLWKSILPILEAHAAAHPGFRVDGIPWERLRDDVPALVEGLQQGTHRVRDFLLEIRDAAKLRQPGRPESFDLRDAAARALQCSRRILPDGAPAELVEGGDPVPLYGVFGSVMQACLQLIDNGRRAAMPTGGCVRIRVERSPCGARGLILVEDDGPGLSAEARAHLTRPFRGAWPGAEQPSLGLGLLIANRVAADHGGFLDARPGAGPPERPGAAVSLVFPLHPNSRP